MFYKPTIIKEIFYFYEISTFLLLNLWPPKNDFPFDKNNCALFVFFIYWGLLGLSMGSFFLVKYFFKSVFFYYLFSLTEVYQ